MAADSYFSLDPTKRSFCSREEIERFADIEARHDAVMLLPLDATEDKQMEGSLIEVTTAEFSAEHSTKGAVVAVGPGRILEDGTVLKIDLKPGDIVWYNEHSPMQVTRKGHATLMVQDIFVIAKDTKTVFDYAL